MAVLSRQVTAKKMYGFVLNTVKVTDHEVFSGEHDGKAVHGFIYAYETYFKLIGISYTNKKIFLQKPP